MNASNPKHVVDYFGGVQKTTTALRLRSRQSVYYWLHQGRVPELRARRIEEMTGGRLKFDPRAYE